MIERYWSEMFGEFEKSPGQFEIPGFPEPLMSAHFGERNKVGEVYPSAKLSFYLCEFLPLKSHQKNLDFKRELLSLAITRSDFWQFQESQGPETAPFMKRLLVFLASRDQTYFHYFIEREGEIVASAIVGQASESALVFNGLVALNHRAQGYARDLFFAIRQDLSQQEVFFWTKHSYLKLGADRITPYVLMP